MFKVLESINDRPRPFEFYTIEELWNDPHTSAQMLQYHLNPDVDLSSRNHAFLNRSADWISARFNLGPETRVADFGCGPGLYSLRLAKTGARVTGIDLSVNSIKYAGGEAEKAGLKIDYINSNYLEFETEDRFDLIVMIMCDFCVLSPAQRKILLSKFRGFLKPGGAILLDVNTLNAFAAREEQAIYEPDMLDGFWAPSKYYCFLNTFKYDSEKVTLDKYTIVEPDRTRTVYNWFQYYSPESLETEFNENGLKITSLLGDVAGSPFDPASDEFAVVVRRK